MQKIWKVLGVLMLTLLIVGSNNVNAESEENIKEKWSKKYGTDKFDSLSSIIQTSNGEYIAIGSTLGQVSSGSSFGAQDAWILKMDSNGNEIWSKQYGNTTSDSLAAVQETNDGGYILAGYNKTTGTGGSSFGWVIKVDANGNEVWSKQYGTDNYNYLLSLQETSDGGYIASGYSSVVDEVNSNGWILKLDSNGNEIWSKNYGTTDNDTLYSIQVASDGGYIAAGKTNGEINSGSALGGDDGWVIKVDSNGNEVWSKQYGSNTADILRSVKETNDGKFVIAGYRDDSGWILKLDNNGNELWSKNYGTTSTERLWSIIVTNDGGYVAAGNTSGKVGSGEAFGLSDGWVLKVDSNGNEIWSKQFGTAKTDRFLSIIATSDEGYIAVGETNDESGSMLVGNNGWVVKINEAYKLNFNSNSGQGNMNSVDVILKDNIKLPSNTFKKTGYKFKGWSTSSGGNATIDYIDKASYTQSQRNNVTLYAVWEKVNSKPGAVDPNSPVDSTPKTPKTGLDNISIIILILVTGSGTLVIRKKYFEI